MVYVEEAYTSSAIGTNLADGKDWAVANFPRKVVRIALCGGAAAADAEAQVFYGSEWIATIKNFKTGAPDKTKLLWHNSGLYLAPGTQLSVKVTDAFSATATFLCLDIVRVRPRSSRRRF